MILARFSRSASAWRAIARCIDSGSSTSLTSTVLTLMPQGSVCSSMICWSRWLICSRWASSSSSSDWPRTLRSVVWAIWKVARTVVGDLGHGVLGVQHAEVQDGAHPDRDVVAGDDFLGRDLQGDDAQVDLHHPVDERDDEEQARPLGADQAAEPEDDAALVLLDDLDRGADDRQHDDEQDDRRRLSVPLTSDVSPRPVIC